jgi:hypothetical protein
MPGDGVYYHLAMHGQEKGHLVEWAPLRRIQSEYLRYQDTGATHYMLINVSNLRPFAISASIATRWLYDGIDPQDPDAAIRRFFQREMGLPWEPALEWHESHTLGAPAFGRMPGCIVGDEGPITLTLRILDSIFRPESLTLEQTMDKVRGFVLSDRIRGADDLGHAIRQTIANYAQTVRLAERLAAAAKPEFREYVAYAVVFQTRYLHTLWRMAEATLDAKIAQQSGDLAKALLALERALSLSDEQHRLLEEVSRGKWLGFYACGVISPTRLPSKRIRWALDVLRGFADAPPGPRSDADQAYDIYHEVKSYQGNRRENVGI